jgi:hypothetical protein
MTGICTNIHNMRMNPCLAWENIRLLTGRETAHHKTNINMAMKLKNGDLASNAKENISVFGMHFHKILNNHRPVDNSVLDLIKQRPCLTTIDAPITFREVKSAINKLKKGKLASTVFLQKPSRQWMTRHDGQCTSMFPISLMERSIMKSGTKVNAC